MNSAAKDGLIKIDSQQIFAKNNLIIILPINNPGRIESLQDLARPGLKLVLGDSTVPAGIYSRQLLDNLSKDPSFEPAFNKLVLANLVSNETDVKQVVAKVQLGEADAGIVYTSDVIAAPGIKTLNIPANLNVLARYPVAVVLNSANPGLAQDFITYLLSKNGQAILMKWGFQPAIP
jgi:molybdate transport system substrate-binding protein